jgi:O-antigen/teichoic acid export membrane protein
MRPQVAADEETPPQDLTRTVVRGASFAAAGYILAQALNLVAYVVLARLLAPEDFGEFAAATLLVGISLMFTESGLASAVIQRRDRIDEAASTATAATLISGATFSLLALAAAPVLGHFFHSDHITELAAASAGLVFMRTSASISDALLQRRFSFLRRMVVEPAQILTFGVTAIICAAAGLGPWALVIGQYAGNVADSVLSWSLVRWRPRLSQISFGMWRELVGYGRHVMVATALIHSSDLASNAIIARTLGTGPLGQFRYALRLAGTPLSLLVAGASYVLFPAFARISHDMERLRGAFLRSLRWTSVFAFPSSFALFALGVPTAVLVFGPTWRPAGEALVAMCLVPGCASLTSIVSEALKAAEKPKYLTRLNATTLSVSIVAMLVLQQFGLTAAAAGLSIGALTGAVYALALVNRVVEVPVRPMLAAIWPAAFAALLAAVGVLALEGFVVDAESHGTVLGLILLLAEGLIGVIAYLAVLEVIDPSVVTTVLDGARAGVRRVIRRRGADPTTQDTPEASLALEPEVLEP